MRWARHWPRLRAVAIIVGAGAFVVDTVAPCATAAAQELGPQLVHQVQPGETLEDIARRYYGDSNRALVVAVANQVAPENRLMPGQRLMVPHDMLLRLERRTSFRRLARGLYDESYRAFLLQEANPGMSARKLQAGAEIRLPFVLRYTLRAKETLAQVASRFGLLPEAGEALIKRFNASVRGRALAGTTVLIPLLDLTLTVGGRRQLKRLQERACKQTAEPDDAALLEEAEALRARGEYARLLAQSSRMIGQLEPAGAPVAAWRKLQGEALVALGDLDAARSAFDALLAEAPGTKLDPVKTSPKIIEVFNSVQQARTP